MKKIVLFFAILCCALNCIAQGYDSEALLYQVEIYAESFNISSDIEKDTEDIFNNGLYIKISHSEVVEEYKFKEYLSELKRVENIDYCSPKNVRAILILTYDSEPKKDVFYIMADREGIVYENTLYKTHPKLCKTIYSFMPKSFFDKIFFSKEESEMYNYNDDDEI